MLKIFKIFGNHKARKSSFDAYSKDYDRHYFDSPQTYAPNGHDIPLHYAVYMADRASLRIALERGDDVNQTDRLGKTALHYAARDGDIDVITALILAGADTEIRDFGGEGSTPKEIAMESGHQGVFETAALKAAQNMGQQKFAFLTENN